MTHRVSKVITDEQLNRTMQIESAGKPNAKASTSTATGLGQFLDQTWFETIYKHGPLELAKQITRYKDAKGRIKYKGPRAILDMRKAGTDKAKLKLNIDTLARFCEDNVASMGAGWTDGDLYLAHFSGAGVARKLVQLPQDAPSSRAYSAAAIEANHRILAGKTIGQVRAWAAHEMRTRWDKAGKPDWIAKYYSASAEVPEPLPDEHYEERPPVKLDHNLMDADGDGFDDATGQPMPEGEPEEAPEPVAPPPIAPNGMKIKGDPETWWVQYRLKAMNYYTGLLDGGYGGKMAAAIAGFLNDWDETEGDISPPKSRADFLKIREALKLEMSRAETRGFKRPVTKERADADPEVVDEVAPEVVPAKRNRFMAWFAGIGTMLTGAVQSGKEYVSQFWNWFTDHRDDLPENGDGIVSTAWGWVTGLPPLVWFGLAASVLIAFAINSHFTVKKIENDVSTGAR